MAHSQKSIRDHARNRTHPNVDNRAISQQIENLVKPCVYNIFKNVWVLLKDGENQSKN